jgi:hypothetical protein
VYAPIPNGTTEKVYDFTCHIPPVGYGVRELRNPDKSHSYLVEPTDVIKRSKKQEDQYWERTPLPDNWDELFEDEEEERVARKNPDFVDSVLEAFRQQEWGRRMKGVWFWNNGKATYITGLHYFYLNWWYINGGYPDYRDVDRRVFYALQFCLEDPDCLGMLEFTSRRSGKSYRSGVWIFEYITRNRQVNGIIQSKNDKDAGDLYIRAVLEPWTELPEFFKPTFNTDKGDKPENGMFFMGRSRRGRRSAKDKQENSLKSQIRYFSAKPVAVDGWAIHRYVSDECGKLELHDITKRHQIVAPCSMERGRIIGKQYYTTTVEDIDDGGGKFRKLVKDSNYKERNELNRTRSGLYKIFTSAAEYEGDFNKYGFTNVIENERRIRILIESQETLADKYGWMRKLPLNEDWALRFTGEGDCMYDAELLNNRIDALELAGKMIERGNLVWKDGFADTEVVWLPNRDGRWTRCWDFKANGPQPNMVQKRGAYFEPENKLEFVIGCDPFSHAVVQDEGRKSLAGAFVKMKNNPGSNDPLNDGFIMMYHSRPASPTIFHEDMIKTCYYFGCQILFENNKNNWEEYFKIRGYERFLMKLDQYEGYGIPGNDKNAETGVDMTEEFINTNINKVFFKTLINQWLRFEFKNRTKYDLAMAAMYTLMADRRNQIRALRTAGRTSTRVESFVRGYIHNGND